MSQRDYSYYSDLPVNETAPEELLNDSGNQSTSGTSRRRMTTLPLSRVSSIMRQCPSTTTVKSDAVGIMAKSTEMFLLELVKNTYECNKRRNRNLSMFRYQDLADYISQSDYSFLKDVIPKKITFRQYKQNLQLKQQNSKEQD